MSILNFIGGIFEPAAKLIDDLHTSEEERLQVKQALFVAQADLFNKAVDYEKSLVEAKAKIITAEAQGASWMQRSWRPVTMLTFLALVVLDALGILPNRLAPEAWTLLQLGLGGYVVGRSAEKMMPKVAEVMRKD